MGHYVEQYPARDSMITLHTWTDVEGAKKKNFYITGVPGTSVPPWFRKVLSEKNLSDIAYFPGRPSCTTEG